MLRKKCAANDYFAAKFMAMDFDPVRSPMQPRPFVFQASRVCDTARKSSVVPVLFSLK